MWSVAETATITDAAMQRWPVQPLIAASTPPAAISGSASGMTITWFLAPPSASTRLSAAVPRR